MVKRGFSRLKACRARVKVSSPTRAFGKNLVFDCGRLESNLFQGGFATSGIVAALKKRGLGEGHGAAPLVKSEALRGGERGLFKTSQNAKNEVFPGAILQSRQTVRPMESDVDPGKRAAPPIESAASRAAKVQEPPKRSLAHSPTGSPRPTNLFWLGGKTRFLPVDVCSPAENPKCFEKRRRDWLPLWKNEVSPDSFPLGLDFSRQILFCLLA